MKRIFIFLASVCALILAGCSGDSKLPEPSGKGTVRAINAIPDAPQVTFQIEERVLGNINYTQSTSPASYDDFEYNFNFDIIVPGEPDRRRFATLTQKIDADREYVFAVSGSVDNPTVTTWVTDLRQWSESETVFEASFAHLSESLGAVDVYFDDPANPPSAANLVATLSPGSIMDIADFPEGSYVVTVTAAGDPNRVPVYTSSDISFGAQTSHLISIFDGSANDTAPYVLRSMTTGGVSRRFADATYPPSIRFIHGARTLQTVDVYDDELLTNLVAGSVAFGTATTDLTGRAAGGAYYFTPEASIATTLFSATVDSPLPGSTGDLYLLGDTDAWQGQYLSQDRVSISTAAKIAIVNAAVNHESFDLYITDRDAPLAEDDSAVFLNIAFSLSTSPVQRRAGSYDIYLTERGTKTQLAGPFPIDVALGDVVLLLAVDDVDPSRIEIRDVSIP